MAFAISVGLGASNAMDSPSTAMWDSEPQVLLVRPSEGAAVRQGTDLNFRQNGVAKAEGNGAKRVENAKDLVGWGAAHTEAHILTSLFCWLLNSCMVRHTLSAGMQLILPHKTPAANLNAGKC